MKAAARRFAEDTKVPVARSRGAIDALMRAWGCNRISWEDDFDAMTATLRFAWTFEGVGYNAKISIKAEPRAPHSADQVMRSLHRLLLLKLKSDLNCVACGLVHAVEVFLPHLVGVDGMTVAESIVPVIRQLHDRPAQLLLTDALED